MSQQRVARMIADHQAAIARQDYPSTDRRPSLLGALPTSH